MMKIRVNRSRAERMTQSPDHWSGTQAQVVVEGWCMPYGQSPMQLPVTWSRSMKPRPPASMTARQSIASKPNLIFISYQPHYASYVDIPAEDRRENLGKCY